MASAPLLPPLPLNRALRPGGYSQPPRTMLDTLATALSRNDDIAALPQRENAAPRQHVAARLDPNTLPRDVNGKIGVLDPHQGGGLLGNLFGWNGNPVYEGIKGSGILDDLAYGLATGTNVGNALGNATQHRVAAGPQRREEAQAQQSRQKLLQSLQAYGEDYADIAEGLASGAIDTNTAVSEMFQRRSDLGQQAKARESNRRNASFISDPTLKAAVESGAMTFADAYKLQNSPDKFINAGDGNILNTSSGEWLSAPGAGAPDLKDQFGYEKDLWAQYANSDPVKTYEAVKGGYERVRESAGQQSGAGDMGLIYGYMRMLDPGSVVRESEFAMAAQAGSFGEQVQGLVTRLLNGERLPASVRKQFLENAEKLYGAAADNLGDINSQFSDRAGGYGVDPGRFIRQPEAFPAFGAPKQISTQQEYQALPSGSQYVAPDGTVRTKP